MLPMGLQWMEDVLEHNGKATRTDYPWLSK